MSDPWFYKLEEFGDFLVKKPIQASGAAIGYILGDVPGATTGWKFGEQIYDSQHPNRKQIKQKLKNVTVGSAPNKNFKFN